MISNAGAAALALALSAVLGVPRTLSAAPTPSLSTSSATLTVAVSVPPQAYFAQRVAGVRVAVLTLVEPGRDPHSYEPRARQLAELGRAEIWFTVGVDFEKTLKPKIASLNPALRIVDTTEKVRYRTLEAHEDGHGEEAGPDPHVWLGRAAVKAQAEAMRDALAELDPANSSEYAAGCAAFAREVDAVFDALAVPLAPLRGKPVFVYHPAFGYFLDEFGIVQVAVETGGKEPTQKGLVGLAARARAEGAKAVFVQAQFPTAAARTLAAAVGCEVVALDSLAPDWLENLRRMGGALAGASR